MAATNENFFLLSLIVNFYFSQSLFYYYSLVYIPVVLFISLKEINPRKCDELTTLKYLQNVGTSCPMCLLAIFNILNSSNMFLFTNPLKIFSYLCCWRFRLPTFFFSLDVQFLMEYPIAWLANEFQCYLSAVMGNPYIPLTNHTA